MEAAEAESAGVVELSERGRLARAWAATASGAQTGLQAAGRPAGAAAGWVKSTAGSGYDAAAGGVEWTVDLASGKWCATTGLCKGNEALDESSATAMR